MIYVTLETLKDGQMRLLRGPGNRKTFNTRPTAVLNAERWDRYGSAVTVHGFADLPACEAYIAQRNFDAKRC